MGLLCVWTKVLEGEIPGSFEIKRTIVWVRVYLPWRVRVLCLKVKTIDLEEPDIESSDSYDEEGDLIWHHPF